MSEKIWHISQIGAIVIETQTSDSRLYHSAQDLFVSNYHCRVNIHSRKKGYELSPSLPVSQPDTRILGAGEVARKGKTVLSIDSSAQVFAVRGVTVKSVLECFDDLAKGLVEDFGIDINAISRFYGFTATYKVPTEKKAYETIAKNLEIPILDKFEEIFSEKLWPSELKLAGANLQANSENWFDISVRPNYERNDSYIFNIIYRNVNKEKVIEFMNSSEQRIEQLVKLIDG